jgi:hypothetical protein
MAEPSPLRVADALDKLVHQFSDPLSFYRELIQNSLDAGSEEVEISLTYEASESGGVAQLQVQDWGCGMNREIIEKQLTRLFSSAKDGDRTKIGKFGIGFVSVFAIDPHIVCVDTSRDGEHWRVLFGRDRRFELRRLDTPVEGTRIRLYKPMPRRDFDQLAERSREVILYWCKHVRGEIRFQGEVLNRPLDLDAPIQVREEVDHTLTLVGHPPSGSGSASFYNRGLTLNEGDPQEYVELAYKISSDHLEHTLTRDNVIRDENYFKVIARLDALIKGPLCREVFARLSALIDADEPPTDYHYRAAAWHVRAQPPHPRGVERHSVALSPSGARLTFQQIHRAYEAMAKGKDGPLLAAARSPLTDALEAAGRLVLLAPPTAPVHHLLRAIQTPLTAQQPASVVTYCTALAPHTDLEEARWRPLAAAVDALMRAHGAKLSGVTIGHFDYPESAIAQRVAITQRRFGELSLTAEVTELGASLFSRRRVLVLGADHPTVDTLISLAHREPEFAAYLLAKLFFLGERLDAVLDGQLAALTLTHRDQRLGV